MISLLVGIKLLIVEYHRQSHTFACPQQMAEAALTNQEALQSQPLDIRGQTASSDLRKRLRRCHRLLLTRSHRQSRTLAPELRRPILLCPRGNSPACPDYRGDQSWQSQPAPVLFHCRRVGSDRHRSLRSWEPPPCSRRSPPHRPSRSPTSGVGPPIRIAASSSTNTVDRHPAPAGPLSFWPHESNVFLWFLAAR